MKNWLTTECLIAALITSINIIWSCSYPEESINQFISYLTLFVLVYDLQKIAKPRCKYLETQQTSGSQSIQSTVKRDD
jgi:hypothetical protein